jgi:hypothetical protein
MTKLADGYTATLYIDDLDTRRASMLLLAALDHQPWPHITRWASPDRVAGGELRTDGLLEVLRAGKLEDPDNVEWELGEDLVFRVGQSGDDLVATWHIYDTAEEHAWRWLAATEEVLARLLEAGMWIRHGVVERVGSGVSCIPALPVVGRRSHLVVADNTGLAWGFDEPEAVIPEGGWEAREINDCWLMSRAMHAETHVDMLEAIQDGHWAMARLAKAGLADYSDIGPPLPEEVPIFHAGAATVVSVGYDADERTAQYSCVLEPGDHIHGWEILALRDLVIGKKMPDGAPVARVEVVFPDEETARLEARPLRDVGVEVAYYGDDGERAYLP